MFTLVVTGRIERRLGMRSRRARSRSAATRATRSCSPTTTSRGATRGSTCATAGTSSSISPLLATTGSGDTPKAGDVVMVRRRNYLVDRVHAPASAVDATRVALICLDDDLLAAQERSIRTELAQHRTQLPLELTDARERAAWLADTQAMTDRLDAITAERDSEPRRIEAVYEVALVRVTPIGMVYLWPGKAGKPEHDARNARGGRA